MPNNQLV